MTRDAKRLEAGYPVDHRGTGVAASWWTWGHGIVRFGGRWNKFLPAKSMSTVTPFRSSRWDAQRPNRRDCASAGPCHCVGE